MNRQREDVWLPDRNSACVLTSVVVIIDFLISKGLNVTLLFLTQIQFCWNLNTMNKF